MFMRKLKIAPRSAICFSIIALVVVLLGLFAINKMAHIRSATIDVSQREMPSYAALAAINERLLRMRITAYRLLVHREEASLTAAHIRITELEGLIKKAQAEYSSLISSEEERKQYEYFARIVAGFIEKNTELVELSKRGLREEMNMLLGGEYKRYSDELSPASEKLFKLNRDSATELAREAESNYYSAIIGVSGFVTLAAVLTGLLAVMLTRSIVNPLRAASDFASVVAKGDLTQKVDSIGGDELAALLTSLNRMKDNLRITVTQIADSSTQLASAAEELNQVTEEANRGAQKQTQEIEQAATAVNEMTAAVDEVARNAAGTSEASNLSDELARDGSQQVGNTVKSINVLGKS